MNKREIQKDTARRQHIFGLIFSAVLIILLVVNIIARDKESSEIENRTLQQRPTVTWQSVSSGTYMEQFESWLADQFAGRNGWRKIYTIYRSISGSRMENDVIIGKEGQLMENIAVPDSELLSSDIEALNQLAETWPNLQVSMLLVPDAATILKNQIPHKVVVADQKTLYGNVAALLDRVNWIDGVGALSKHTSEKLYYQTDHHWTSQGAYDMFLETAASLGIEHPEDVSYRVYPVTTSFNGTLSGMSGHMLKAQEEIDVYIPDTETPYVVTYVEEQEKTASLYRTAPLKTKDKYAVFLGGNYSRILIDTAADADRTLLLVKDSFANSFVPFLVPYYKKIIMVDPRYYTGTITDLMNSYEITDVLFLYSGNTFFQDTNVAGFLSQ